MQPDIWTLYSLMLKSRLFEQGIARLWHDGRISGELHQGTGEEAIVAGVVSHLREGDAMALDHRGTAALLMRGENPISIVQELMGSNDGLCRGCGGHMHLYSKPYLAASSGIVGASGPTAAGFALAARYLRPASVSVAFFGEGSMNQGMMMESLNLASVWNLPVLFVCKDDNWSITTRSDTMTGGEIKARARGLGVDTVMADGLDVREMWKTAGHAIGRIRDTNRPVFLHARCVHLDAHFLGFQLKRAVEKPVKEMPQIAIPLSRSMIRPGGGGVMDRLAGLKAVLSGVVEALRDPRRDLRNDPVAAARKTLTSDSSRLTTLEMQVQEELNRIFKAAWGEETG
jgi:TPP-dependent pyruvate/acetoin dehydrogenase alpha subunit